MTGNELPPGAEAEVEEMQEQMEEVMEQFEELEEEGEVEKYFRYIDDPGEAPDWADVEEAPNTEGRFRYETRGNQQESTEEEETSEQPAEQQTDDGAVESYDPEVPDILTPDWFEDNVNDKEHIQVFGKVESMEGVGGESVTLEKSGQFVGLTTDRTGERAIKLRQKKRGDVRYETVRLRNIDEVELSDYRGPPPEDFEPKPISSGKAQTELKPRDVEANFNQVQDQLAQHFGKEATDKVAEALEQWDEGGYTTRLSAPVWQAVQETEGGHIPDQMEEVDTDNPFSGYPYDEGAVEAIKGFMKICRETTREEFGESVTLYRGFKSDSIQKYGDIDVEEGEVTIQPQAMESWTLDEYTAMGYGDMEVKKEFDTDDVGFLSSMFMTGAHAKVKEVTITGGEEYTIEPDDVEGISGVQSPPDKVEEALLKASIMPLEAADWIRQTIDDDEVELSVGVKENGTFKYWRYIDDPSAAPDWADVEEAPNTNRYRYETDPEQGGGESEDDSTSSSQIDEGPRSNLASSKEILQSPYEYAEGFESLRDAGIDDGNTKGEAMEVLEFEDGSSAFTVPREAYEQSKRGLALCCEPDEMLSNNKEGARAIREFGGNAARMITTKVTRDADEVRDQFTSTGEDTFTDTYLVKEGIEGDLVKDRQDDPRSRTNEQHDMNDEELDNLAETVAAGWFSGNRDLHAANVMIGEDGKAYVIDHDDAKGRTGGGADNWSGHLYGIEGLQEKVQKHLAEDCKHLLENQGTEDDFDDEWNDYLSDRLDYALRETSISSEVFADTGSLPHNRTLGKQVGDKETIETDDLREAAREMENIQAKNLADYLKVDGHIVDPKQVTFIGDKMIFTEVGGGDLTYEEDKEHEIEVMPIDDIDKDDLPGHEVDIIDYEDMEVETVELQEYPDASTGTPVTTYVADTDGDPFELRLENVVDVRETE